MANLRSNPVVQRLIVAGKGRLFTSRWHAKRSRRTASAAEPTVYIAGWYGTETAGDRLILLGLISQIRQQWPGIAICIVSSNIYYTTMTVQELAYVIRMAGAHADDCAAMLMNTRVAGEDVIGEIAKGDLLVYGGGPLMDDPNMLKWRAWAVHARQKGASVAILGCGIGPARLAPAQKAIGEIVALADLVILRHDAGDVPFTVARTDIVSGLCPSLLTWRYLRYFGPPAERSGTAVNFRKVPKQYFKASQPYVKGQEEWLAGRLTPALRAVLADAGTVFSTHELDQIGDLAFTTELMRQLRAGTANMLVSSSLMDLIECLRGASRAVAMRYHGAILSLLMGCEVIGIDYDADGGKLVKLFRDIGLGTAPNSVFDAEIGAQSVRIPPDRMAEIFGGLDTLYTDGLSQLSLGGK